MKSKIVKILAIDDNNDNLIVLQALLMEKFPEAKVFLADSGKKGIEQALVQQPDLIFLDIVMPIMDGFQVCAKLKSDNLLKHIPIIILTAGKTDKKTRIKAIELGVDAFLAKPIDEEELTVQVKAMLRIKRLEDLLREEKENLSHNLNERIKELNCLYNISQVVERDGITLENIFEETVNLIPPGWQYPEITCVRIIIENMKYQTDNFLETKWKQSVDIAIQGEVIGEITLCYLEEKPEMDEGPFLKEERNLIGAISERLGIITQRKQAEFLLRESEEKLSALYASMTEMVVIHDLVFDENNNPVNYRITDSNNAFTKITGITRETAVGKLANELYGTDEPPYLDEYSQVCLSGKPYFYETYFAPMEKHFSISVVSTGENKFATITKDITELKHIQQIIKTKNKELEQIVYVASHDLRSPLINLDGFGRELEYSIKAINSIMEETDTESDLEKTLKAELPEMNQALGHIRNSTLQMDVLLNGLLKLSRSGRAALQILPIDMNELLQKTTESLEFKAKKSGNEIELSELPSCKGDSVQLTQIFTNLIDNSIKYSNPNRSGKIKVSGRIENGNSLYCVEDNGIGIAENHLSNIFELFHRLDKNTTEGEGLGLTIVKQILSRLNGDIRVESKLGEGSSFYITLPYAKVSKNTGE